MLVIKSGYGGRLHVYLCTCREPPDMVRAYAEWRGMVLKAGKFSVLVRVMAMEFDR